MVRFTLSQINMGVVCQRSYQTKRKRLLIKRYEKSLMKSMMKIVNATVIKTTKSTPEAPTKTNLIDLTLSSLVRGLC